MPPLALLALSLLLSAPGPAGAVSTGWPDASPGVAAAGPTWLGPKPPAAVRRVVSLAPSATDTVIALGHADLLAGVTRYDTAPEVAKLPRVGGFLDPVPEAILALKPDLVIWVTDGGALSAVQRIADLGVPVLALPVIGVADVIAAARLVARAIGDPTAGDRLVASLEQAIARTRVAAANVARVRVLLAVGREPLVVAGPGSYPDELLRIAGGVNVVQGGRSWPIYPLERAVADDPDVVIDAAVNEHGGGLGHLSAIPAVRRGHLRVLKSDDALRPGPRLASALAELFRALHPGMEPP